MWTFKRLSSDRDIYDFTIEVISRATDSDPQSCDQLNLSFLRPSVMKLRESFGLSQVANGYVSVDYADEIALAYMCAYFPAYVKLARQSVESILKDRNLDFRSLDSFDRITILGCGPCPEIAAISYLMSISRDPTKRLEVHILDQNHSGWSRCTHGVIATARSFFPNTNIEIYMHDIDFTSSDFQRKIQFLPRSDLILGQNLTNEASSSMDQFVENLLALSKRCKPNGSMLLVDQENSSTFRCFGDLQNSMTEEMTFSLRSQSFRIDLPNFRRHKALWTVLDASQSGLIPRTKVHTQRLQLGRKSLHG